jgi:hypothetical protein
MLGGVLVSPHRLGLLFLFAAGCGRTPLLSGDRASDAATAEDPVQGVWVQDFDLPGPRIYIDVQFSFEAGSWLSQALGGQGSTRHVDMGTYVVDGDALDMTVTASSCQGLLEVPTPAATFERHGDKLILNWQYDKTSFWSDVNYLRRAAVLSDLGQLGCGMSPGGFLPNPIKPVP